MFRNYIRKSVFIASAATSYYFIQQDSPMKHRILSKM
jgi:glycerol-3-phosphate dehydrogenase